MNLKRTKTIATIGPASESKDILTELIGQGVDVLRINCSHSDEYEIVNHIKTIRNCALNAGRQVGILLDLQGPKIRTGKLENGAPVMLVRGQEITITSDDIPGNSCMISIPHPAVCEGFSEGDKVLLSDGMIELKIKRREGAMIIAEVIKEGLIGEQKGVNLPSVRFKMSAITEKDIADLHTGLACGVDYIALSFVRSAQDIRTLRRHMGDNKKNVQIIAKIEKPEAIEVIDEVLTESDGIMVARGDLGVELPLQMIPLIQKKLLAKARDASKLAIVATQMMESMITQYTPTRAEVTDVANAVLDGADACMLSGETAIGKHPVATVAIMHTITTEVELSDTLVDRLDDWHDCGSNYTHALAESACVLAKVIGAKAILAFTMSGRTALLLSKHKPATQIFGLTPDPLTLRRMALYWGVRPELTRECRGIDEMVSEAKTLLLDKKLLKKGDTVVIVAGNDPSPGGSTFIKLDHC
ncbi:MAG: pyruvate kinase [Candidatus Auribacterota bacterium]|jgi:pyruvate kinase|nr:pyruvate kinase [Candidatus Auribacterota bacterium]